MFFKRFCRDLFQSAWTVANLGERFCPDLSVKAGRIAIAAVMGLITVSTQAAVYRVKAGASSNGPGTATDWSDAWNNLQDALNYNLLVSGDQIWVAATADYKPGTNRGDGFPLKNGVAVLGAFSGSETAVGQRNLANLTVLSGDIDSDDVLDNDNSYHVVTAGSNVTPPAPIPGIQHVGNLDGFIVTMGAATGSGTNENCGGGLFINQGHPRIRNCIFTENTSTNCGGGVYCLDTDIAPEFRNCQFLSNILTNSGSTGAGVGGNYSVTLINCLLKSNTASKWGAALNIDWTGDCENPEHVFEINAINCQFVDNENAKYGAAIYAYGCGTMTLTNCLFNNNRCTSLLSSDGGAIWTGGLVESHAANCTFVHNSVEQGTGGAWSDYAFGPISTVTNCVFYANEAPDSRDMTIFGIQVTMAHSATQQGISGTGNITLNSTTNPPHFVDNNQTDPNLNDYRLTCDSPCLNAGSDGAVPDDNFDVDENSETTGQSTPDLDVAYRMLGTVDMGSFERQLNESPPCTGDIFPVPCGNGTVDVDDLLLVINSWGACDGPCPADLYPSGEVDVDDLLVVINSSGDCESFDHSGLQQQEQQMLLQQQDWMQGCLDDCTKSYPDQSSSEWFECFQECVKEHQN